MLTTVRYILLTAIRDKLFYGIYGLIALCFVLSFGFGDVSLVEEKQASIVFAASSVRIIVMIGLVLFVSFHVHRLFDTREIDSILSKPISRMSFVLAYFLGVGIISLLIVVPSALLLLYVAGISHASLFWTLSLLLESLLVISFSLCAALVVRSAVFAVLGAYGFYIMSRMMAYFIYTLDNRWGAFGEFYRKIAAYFIKFISIVIPRLDLFTKSEWLVYPAKLTHEVANLVLLQSLIYIPLIMIIAVFDISRKQF